MSFWLDCHTHSALIVPDNCRKFNFPGISRGGISVFPLNRWQWSGEETRIQNTFGHFPACSAHFPGLHFGRFSYFILSLWHFLLLWLVFLMIREKLITREEDSSPFSLVRFIMKTLNLWDKMSVWLSLRNNTVKQNVFQLCLSVWR